MHQTTLGVNVTDLQVESLLQPMIGRSTPQSSIFHKAPRNSVSHSRFTALTTRRLRNHVLRSSRHPLPSLYVVLFQRERDVKFAS